MSGQSNNDSDGYLISQALQALRVAGSSNSDGWTAIREYWVVLAKGGADPFEAARWAGEIATRVVTGVFEAEPDGRPRAALKALGLIGVEGEHRKERDYILLREEFQELTKEAGRTAAKLTRKEFAQAMLNSGFFEGLSVGQAMKAIDHIKKTYVPKR